MRAKSVCFLNISLSISVVGLIPGYSAFTVCFNLDRNGNKSLFKLVILLLNSVI